MTLLVISYQTYNEAKKIIDKEIRKYVALYDDDVLNVVLISNKNDIQKINVPSDEVSVFCKTNKFMFFEISVKTNLKNKYINAKCYKGIRFKGISYH